MRFHGHRRPLSLLQLLAALPFAALPARGTAQLATPGRPASASADLSADVPLVVLPRPDVAALLAEDAARTHGPFRYGATIPVALSAADSGRWDDAGGLRVWRLRIASPGAHSLGVLFDAFDLPPGGQVFLYDRDPAHVLGAFTAANGRPNGKLQVQPLPGDELTIEYVQPRAQAAVPRLRVGQVIHDYRGILARLSAAAPPSPDALCFVDINCPQGAPYQDIKRAVVELLIGGSNCTGSILNNTAEDGTPYLMTANHCGDMTNAVVVFGYELSGCASGTSSQALTLSGASLLAASATWDSQLYLLSQAPPQSYAPFYAGWGLSAGQAGPGVGISHPNGLPKVIAVDNQNPVRTSVYWQVGWDTGMVGSGSSGSPLFNGVKRVIGTACCVTNFTCGSQIAFYGRLDGFWTAAGFGRWLDPLGLGSTFINGLDPFQASATPYNGSGVNPSAYASVAPPVLGATWTAQIDTSAQPGAVLTLIQAHAAPFAALFFFFGELLVDVGSPFHFQSLAPVTGNASVHALAVPNVAALAGAVSHTQAFVLSGSLQATNGVKLRFGTP